MSGPGQMIPRGYIMLRGKGQYEGLFCYMREDCSIAPMAWKHRQDVFDAMWEDFRARKTTSAAELFREAVHERVVKHLNGGF